MTKTKKETGSRRRRWLERATCAGKQRRRHATVEAACGKRQGEDEEESFSYLVSIFWINNKISCWTWAASNRTCPFRGPRPIARFLHPTVSNDGGGNGHRVAPESYPFACPVRLRRGTLYFNGVSVLHRLWLISTIITLIYVIVVWNCIYSMNVVYD